jgi:ABC-type multidrug transport system ATPase subunit
VTWDGVDTARDPDAVRTRVGYLPQDFGIYPNLTPIDFLSYLAAAKGIPARDTRRRVGELLALVNLTDASRKLLGGFSGGMRQRVGIAQALLNDPRLLIVDEPTAGLDPEERVRFRDLLAELAGDRIVILSTHIVSDVEAAATSIAMIANGRLIRHAAPEALLHDIDGSVWTWTVPSADLDAVRRDHLVTGTVRRADGVHVRVVAAAPPCPDAQPQQPNLEDAYLYAMVTSRQEAAA